MDRQTYSFVYWSCLVCLMAVTLFGLSSRYLSGKKIEPLSGMVAGSGSVFLMFLHARLEAAEDVEG